MDKIYQSKEEFAEQYRQHVRALSGKEFEDTSDIDRFTALAKMIAGDSRVIVAQTDERNRIEGKKRVYYFSIEFLIGRLLDNYLLNLGIRDLVAEAIADMGGDLDEIERQEPDPALGNGGLGRLAACFLDSMAHEGIAGYGNGMRYRYGLFKQEIVDGRQVEVADEWLSKGYPWEVKRPDKAVRIGFGGHVVSRQEGDRLIYSVEDTQDVLAVPYDIPIVGYGGKTVNKLRCWSAEPIDVHFDLEAFNAGDYTGADRDRANAEAISAILYPNDAGEHGRLLRLKQEYLFVAAGIRTLLDTFEREHGDAWDELPRYVAIHTNDTHPAMCGPELMRILMDEKGLSWDEAWDIVTSTVSYTNHTILPEALEKWPISTFSVLLPRVYQIIDEINRRWREGFDMSQPESAERLRATAVLWDGEVRMANLSVICSHSVNGVAKIHTDILKASTLKDFAALKPAIFNNKTNGICHRRFFAEANPTYAKLVSEAIGDAWLDDASELEKLTDFEGDASFLERVGASKRANKIRLAEYVKRECGLVIDPNTIFDVQVKRFHAYKRQLLNIMKVMDLYNRRLADPNFKIQPTTFIFSGKAASSYTFAKEVIRLINGVANVVNNDPRVNDIMKVCFIPNFRVSNAQLIYPAAEISEQISTAGKEASGTSNMKLMMNGAITLGTMDGANIEIVDLAGRENEAIFGLTTPEVDELRASGQYFAWDIVNSDRTRLGRIIEELTDGTFAALSGNFESIHHEVMLNNDYDLVLKDFHSYVDTWEALTATYPNAQDWNRRALHNTAMSGWFSSDRTIREYRDEIWHA
ncbi:glycogen/starch/alpha-glucan phosphorylase [Collinsella sp. BM28]|uniref:glycogen/starch/alpha-glucan phosphorylase n=1 Tax=Collinsella sp. BM28 TaxID=3378285 RepID=UPI00389291E3